jgi:UDP-N-acetylmuramate--alanine ligase
MTKLDKKIYFIGIGGISMQGIAKLLKSRGANVVGSDLKKSDNTDELTSCGIEVNIGHDAKNIDQSYDYVVKSNAIPDDNPELKKAKKINLPVLSNTQMIDKISAENYMIAVAGAHGKSTTSAMITYLLTKMGKDPIAFLGAKSNQIGGSYRDGEGGYVVVEACEYKKAFLDLKPDLAIITNIEEEHLDYYKNLDEIKAVFSKFINNLKSGGKLIVCGDNEIAMDVVKSSGKDFLSYGSNQSNDYQVDRSMNLKVFGKHNYLNATAAIAVCDIIGLPMRDAGYQLEKFQGIKRRSEYIGRKESVLIYDDYAHHPTEIKATLKSFRDRFKNKKIFLVFQPHQMNRLNSFFDQFVSSLVIADKIIITKTFDPAGRQQEKGKDSIDLHTSLKEAGADSYYAKNFDQATRIVNKFSEPGDILITMGAGPVYKVSQKYLKL